jgi:hypothetical protein
MNVNRIVGYFVLAIGIAAIAFGFYIKSRTSHAREELKGPGGIFGIIPNPVEKTIGDIAESKIQQYEQAAMWCFIGGGLLILIGGILIVVPSKPKKRGSHK